MAEMDSQLSNLEGRLQNQEASSGAFSTVDQHLQVHQALEAEFQSCKFNYSSLNQMTDDLLSMYHNEDTNNLQSAHQALAIRLQSLESLLDQRKAVGHAFRQQTEQLGNVEGFLDQFDTWLHEQETEAHVLLEEIISNDTRKSSSWTIRQQDLQSQIDSHHSQLNLLNTNHRNKVKTGSNSASDVDNIKKKLDDINERWTLLRDKTAQIRVKLETNMDQWNELINRCRALIDFLTARENELLAYHPVAGSVELIQKQRLAFQNWNERLDSKSSEIEQAISTGRLYLEREGADRRLSSASCDSKIIEELNHESSDVKTFVKNIRRHVRLLNHKWLELHNKSGRWQNLLATSAERLEAIDGIIRFCSERLSNLESTTEAWRNVNDYSVSELPSQLSTARHTRSQSEDVADRLQKCQGMIQVQEQEASVRSDVKLTLSGLAERQKRLDEMLRDRVSQLISLNRSLVPEIEDLLKDSVSRPYERAATPSGVPYYINHEKKGTQWDHPHMINLLAQLPKFNSTKFSAYRTAQKLRMLQKALGLNYIRLKDVIRCAHDHKLVCSDANELIDVSLMINCLQDLFEHLADERHATGVNVPLSIDLTLNWILNVFDLSRQGHLKTLSFLVGLVIMCRGAVADKFNYLLSCLADSKSGLIDDRKLSILLSNCVQIPRQLGELKAFGGANIGPSVASCLEQSKGANAIDSKQFMDWLSMEPQSMVWLPVFHRLATSESCKHQAKCTLCKTQPIIGLRYRCLRCFNFNLCQACFFMGKKGKSHKLSHPMKEYYCASTSSDDMKDLSSPMKKKYSSGRYIKKHNPKGYLPLNKLADNECNFSRESTTTSSPSTMVQPKYNVYDSVTSNASANLTIDRHQEDSDIHRDIQVYAHTLEKLEKCNVNNGNSNVPSLMLYSQSSLSSDLDGDEHKIIERYCTSLTSPAAQHISNGNKQLPNQAVTDSPLRSPMQIVMSLEENQKTELEAMIKDLEDENRNLQTEYQKLQAERDQSISHHPVSPGSEKEAEMLAEAKLLRQHKTRLESRMKILEDHNKQLEAQLKRLRLLLEQPSADNASSEFSIPMASSEINSPLRTKKLPPNYEKQTSDGISSSGSAHRTPRLHGSIGELFQKAGQVGQAVGHLVAAVSDNQDSYATS